MRKLRNEELKRLSIEDFRVSPKNNFVVVLDNIRSMHNVGSTFRTCDAFLAEKLFLCGITAQPPHRDIKKTALGATESVDWEYYENTLELIKKLKAEGYEIVAIEQADESTSLEYFNINKNAKYAFVFGNEVFGVDESIVKLADACVEIPQFGTKHSLNISVSVGVVVWDYFYKLKK